MDKDEAKVSAQVNSAVQSKLQDGVAYGSIISHSVKSSRSGHSSHASRASIAAAKACADAKATVGKIPYAQKMIELKVEQLRNKIGHTSAGKKSQFCTGESRGYGSCRCRN